MAGIERSYARDVLRDILDETAEKRDVFADAIRCDRGLLGKKLHGTDGRDIGLGELELLDRDIQVQWMKRYGKLLGLEVYEVSAGQLLEEFCEQFEEMQRITRLVKARLGKAQMAKAELPAPVTAKRSA